MMTVRLIAHTPEPEKVVAAAAKLCYSDAHITDLLDGLTEEKTAKFLTMLSDLGHASPIEHASFTFGIEGVSRTLLAQITRHRIASFSVQSQRYVRLDDFRYVVPPEIEAIPEAKEAFLASMEEDAKRYLDLAHKLEEGHTARLMAEGMPEKQARAKASKQANEDARFVLPNACETKMVVTMNARSLQNFFHLRCCSRAQWRARCAAAKPPRCVQNMPRSKKVPKHEQGQTDRTGRAGRQRQGHAGKAAGSTFKGTGLFCAGDHLPEL